MPGFCQADGAGFRRVGCRRVRDDAIVTASPSAPPAPVHVAGRRLGLIFAALLLGMFLAALDQTIVATALPTIVGELGGLNHLSWVVTAYLLAQTVSTPLYGKLGDQYGRKLMFQVAIVIFLVGSVLCGLAQSMGQLIAFRAIQGLGGGGLMVTALAIVGDVVPPRDRGRYQGVFGAVFGVSSVAGPLLGGFFVDNASWRWVFYINLPLGLIALVVVASVLHAPTQRVRHRTDYVGALVISLGITCVVLVTSLGGSTYAWTSSFIIGLSVAAVVLIVLAVRVERRAAEPILAPRLFANRVFGVTSAVGFIVGLALFGALTFLPLFMQTVEGVGPTESGLRLTPLMGGVLVMSIASGRIISRTGVYKPFPIAGTALMGVGMLLLSTLDAGTGALRMSLYMVVLGLGLGATMQVLVIAVQNAVHYRDLGAATSGATFFRSIGGTVGVAVFGAIFSNRLAANLARDLPATIAAQMSGQREPSVAQLQALPPAVRTVYLTAFTGAFGSVFLTAAGVSLAAFLLTWFIPQLPLRAAAAVPDPGEASTMGTERTSEAELTRALSVLARRDNIATTYADLASRAGLDLSPADCWLLLRLGEHTPVAADDLPRQLQLSDSVLGPHLDRLTEQGDLARNDGMLTLTEPGRAVVDRLVDTRSDQLAALLGDVTDEERPELMDVLHRLTASVLAAPAGRLLLAGAHQTG
jgi:EmrB/QacA subfamily drug resistance transporter